MSLSTPDDLVRTVTRRIAEVRQSLGITQAEMAERLETALNNYKRIERGQNITIHTLARIAVQQFLQQFPRLSPA